MSEAAFSYTEDHQDYEIIGGQVYMMSRPNMKHATVQGNIFRAFSNYLEGKRCQAILEQDVYLNDDDNFIPDVMIVCNPDIIEDDGIYGAPDLIVEILSPSTARNDRKEKFAAYEKYGVKEYWIVDPKNKFVEVYLLRDGVFVLDEVYTTYEDFEWKRLTDKQREAVKHAIKLSLYDDFEVPLKDIFDRVN